MAIRCPVDALRMLGTADEALALLRPALPWRGVQGVWGPALLATAVCASSGQLGSDPTGDCAASSASLRHALVRAGPPRPAQPAPPRPGQSVSLFGLVLPALAFGVLVAMERGPLVSLPAGRAVAAIVAVALVANAGPRRGQRRLQGRSARSLLGILRDHAVGLLLMAPQLGIVLVMAMQLRAPFELGGALPLTAAIGTSAAVAVHAGLPLLRVLGVATPAPARLAANVCDTAERPSG